MRVFSVRPKSVQPIDASGVRWAVGEKGLEVEIASIGRHALLVVT